MKRALATFGPALLALVAGLGLAWWWFGNSPQPVPAFEITDLDGDTRRASDWRGNVLVLNFWATWCKPCRDEIPMLVEAQDRLGDRGLQIVGVAVDEIEPVRRFADEFSIDYPVLVDAMAAMKLQDALRGGSGLPYTAVIDRKGRVHAGVAGELDRARFDRLVEPLLAPEQP